MGLSGNCATFSILIFTYGVGRAAIQLWFPRINLSCPQEGRIFSTISIGIELPREIFFMILKTVTIGWSEFIPSDPNRVCRYSFLISKIVDHRTVHETRGQYHRVEFFYFLILGTSSDSGIGLLAEARDMSLNSRLILYGYNRLFFSLRPQRPCHPRFAGSALMNLVKRLYRELRLLPFFFSLRSLCLCG